MLAYWIWLAELKMKPSDKKILLGEFSDPEEIYYAEEEAFLPLKDLSPSALEVLADKDLSRVHRIEEVCGQKGIGILTMADSRYPDRLRAIADPPVILYYLGTFPDLSQRPGIAVVGTRKASEYGLRSARRLSGEMAACGARVISGGAIGVDSWAMEGALTTDLGHMLVLGCGVDVVYPRCNKELFNRVLLKGCIVSEYAPGTEARSWHFPARNRIISGISDGVVVVEAPERSGALITAREAVDQGRELFVVPGNIDVESCAGSNALLRKGAIAAFGGWDVVSEFTTVYPGVLRKAENPDRPDPEAAEKTEILPSAGHISEKSRDKKEKTGKISIDKKADCTYSDAVSMPADLTPQEKSVLSLIGREPVAMDELMANCDLPSGALLSALTMLSMKGVVKMHPGRRVSLK